MPTNYTKKDPDLLLKDINLSQNRLSQKGKLRVFLGMCPGVGKTFAMLSAAHIKKKEGVDIVIGVIETHKRADTERMVDTLEIIPLKESVYKDIIVKELDIDAVIARKPSIVLIDELAHHNAPGSRHPKRYQDVIEILDHGIDVYTTVNIQHIETRSDLVTQITKVQITETVPDSIIEMASQVELIDLQPEELLRRLDSGKVYLKENIDRAKTSFFKIEHLIALRELALRFTAEIVDTHLRSEMSLKGIQGPWNTNERLLVAISHSPHSEELIKTTRRMAFNLEAPWIALYIESPGTLNEEDQKQLNENITLSKKLGAEFITIQESNVVTGIERIAKQRNVSQLILGRPDKKILEYVGAKNLIEILSERLPELDIHLVRQKNKFKKPNQIKNLFKTESSVQNYYNPVLILFGVTFLNFFIRDFIGYRSVGFIYLFTVLVISSFSNRGPIIFSAFFSALVWEFFFIPPYFTFHISEKEDILLCFTYIIVALFTGYLSNQKQNQQKDLINRNFRSQILYKSAKSIIEAKSISEVIEVTEKILFEIYNNEVYFFSTRSTDDQKTLDTISFNKRLTLNNSELAVCQWSYHQKQKAGFGTETLSSVKIICYPMYKTNKNYGVFAIMMVSQKQLNLSLENIVETIINLCATAIENLDLQEESKQRNLLIQSEKLHQSLLNSISHEIRIPLTSIQGNLNLIPKNEENEITLNNINKAAFRLNRVIENLLDMSRISSGKLELKKEIIDVQDFFYEIISNYKDSLDEVKILNKSSVPLYVLGDSKILEHALFNILYNARQFSNENDPIEVTLENRINNIVIEIKDFGPGIPHDELEIIFDRFRRLKNKKTGGVGLGLSISKEVIEAHDGQLMAKNSVQKSGAIFVITLPKFEIKKGII